MIWFDDDIAIQAESEADLKHIMGRMDEMMGNEYNVKIDKGKTKILVCGKEGSLRYI